MADSGMRDEYNQLYMAVINRNNDYSTAGAEEPKALIMQKRSVSLQSTNFWTPTDWFMKRPSSLTSGS